MSEKVNKQGVNNEQKYPPFKNEQMTNRTADQNSPSLVYGGDDGTMWMISRVEICARVESSLVIISVHRQIASRSKKYL